MTSSTNYSDVNIRPRRYRGIRSSKKSILYSDYNPDEDSKNGNLGQRSISLTALPHNGTNSVSATTPAPSPGPLLEPRMAQLETLEAKMASIEVSLSTAPRRKNGKKNGNNISSNANKTSAFGGTTSPANIFASIRSNTLIDTCRELEILRNALKDKENTIQNLQGQMNCCGRLTSLQPLDPSERRSAEIRLQSLKQEEESRKSAIKKINLTLEQIDANEANIDVRIKQAELEYELGREELGLLGVKEEMRTLQARLDAKPTPTLYSCVSFPGKYTLHCVQLEYDPKSPRFGAGNLDDKIGLFVLWAAENSRLQKGDRILEVNGKLTLSTSKEEMIRLLTVCPSKAEIVVFRVWTPPPSTEDFLRRENLRLTHRISYLEDQVSELLILTENVTTLSQVPNSSKKQTAVFQKGSHVALLSTPQKNGSKPNSVNGNSDSGSRLLPTSSEMLQDNQKMYNDNNLPKNAMNSNHVPVGPSEKYHEAESYQMFPPKLHNTGGKIRTLTKKYEKDEFSSTLTKCRWKKESEEDEYGKKHLHNLSNSKNGLVQENSYSLSDLERPSRKSGQVHGRLVDYSSETSCARYKFQKDRKGKIFDEEEAKTKQNSECEGENQNKPTPPKKPIRLSINKATSLQNVETGYSFHNAVRKMKRPHKGEAPQPPVSYENKVNSNGDSQYIACESASSRTSSRAESWKTLAESNARWPTNYHRSKCKSDEKWC